MYGKVDWSTRIDDPSIEDVGRFWVWRQTAEESASVFRAPGNVSAVFVLYVFLLDDESDAAADYDNDDFSFEPTLPLSKVDLLE